MVNVTGLDSDGEWREFGGRTMRMKLMSAVAAIAFMSGQAGAQNFSGTTVDFQYYFPTAGTAYPFASNGSHVVGAGIEIADVAGGGNMDISASTIQVNFLGTANWTTALFNGWVLSDTTNNVSTITGVTINPLTNLAGFSQSNIVWNANSITVNWQGLAYNPETIFSLDVAFDSATPAVPEPSSWAMMLLGFGAIGFSMRRRPANRRQVGA